MNLDWHGLYLGMGYKCCLLCCADLLYKKKDSFGLTYVMFDNLTCGGLVLGNLVVRLFISYCNGTLVLCIRKNLN